MEEQKTGSDTSEIATNDRDQRPVATKSALKIMVIVIVVLVVAGSGLFYVAYRLNLPTGRISDSDVVVTVQPGDTVDSIASELQSKHIIRSGLLLRALSRLKGSEYHFQAGSFLVPKEASLLTVYRVLTSGTALEYKITVPEGFTLSQIAKLLQKNGITTSEEFEKAAHSMVLLKQLNIPDSSAEGYLFPDTYMFPKEYPADKIVDKMVTHFFQVLKQIEPPHDSLTPKQLLQKVTLASIVEREYRVPDEAPIIASVFYNRLAIGMRLQSCATVAYVMTEQLGLPHPDVLTYKDLKYNSPYNTYEHAGLPPGPISNPGRTALRAVFYPAKSDYFYFVLKDPNAGRHEFSVTYDQHNAAKYLYLKRS